MKMARNAPNALPLYAHLNSFDLTLSLSALLASTQQQQKTD